MSSILVTLLILVSILIVFMPLLVARLLDYYWYLKDSRRKLEVQKEVNTEKMRMRYFKARTFKEYQSLVKEQGVKGLL